MFAHKVWSVGPGFRIDAIGADGPVVLSASKLIVATGTIERVVPFPGWTTPGVIGLAAATLLLKSQRMLPGRSTVVAGCGPLLVAVAAGILKGGGHVVAVIDVAGPTDWLDAAARMLSRPDLLARGARWLTAIRAAGVPLLSRHALSAVRERGDALEATVARVEADGTPIPGTQRTLTADCVAVGNGLTPGSDVSRVLRAQHRYDAAHGGWVAATDALRPNVGGWPVRGGRWQRHRRRGGRRTSWRTRGARRIA